MKSRSIKSYPDRTLVDFVASHAAEDAGRIAVSFKGRHLTYREIDQASDALANALASAGVKKGDRVALLLPNCPQFVIAELAVWKLGAIIAPQNLIYTERELAEAMRITSPEVAIVLTPFYEKLKKVQHETSIRKVIATNIKEYLPTVLRVLFTLLKEKKEGHRIDLQPGDVWLQKMISDGAGKGKPVSVAKPGDPAVVLMTGGTTGTPKAAMALHRSAIMSGTQLLDWLRDALRDKNDSIMLPLPLFHTYGCMGAQSMTMIDGIRLILVPNPRELADVLKTINREHPTLLCGVPTLFNGMLHHPLVEAGKIDFKSIRACFSGASALMAETKKRFEGLTGGKIVEGYSLTEASMACVVNPLDGVNKIGSIGLPVGDVEIRIVDSDDGMTELAPNEVGELIMQAPQLMTGFWNNPAETAEMLRMHDDGRMWLHTGDLAYIDDDGFTFIVDRKKDLIKSSGCQVWPREIEEVIAKHPSVAEVGVAGVPHEHRGEVIHAWVVPRPGVTVSDADLMKYCRENLAPFKVPAKIEIRSELPKTMVGKVLRRVLVAETLEKAAAG